MDDATSSAYLIMSWFLMYYDLARSERALCLGKSNEIRIDFFFIETVDPWEFITYDDFCQTVQNFMIIIIVVVVKTKISLRSPK
jgi:hypothetical protein